MMQSIQLMNLLIMSGLNNLIAGKKLIEQKYTSILIKKQNSKFDHQIYSTDIVFYQSSNDMLLHHWHTITSPYTHWGQYWSNILVIKKVGAL